MLCRAYTDFPTFAALVLPWLAGDPVGNNVLSTVVDGRTVGKSPPEPDGAWLTVTEDDRIHGVQIHGVQIHGVATVTPPGGALLSMMPARAAELVAEYLAGAALGPALPFVVGPIDASTAFAKCFTERTGRAAYVTADLRIFQLQTVRPPAPAPGRARAATGADRDLLVAWSSAFAAEATPSQPGPDPTLPVDSRLAASAVEPGLPLLWLWEVDGEPVSMAWLSPPFADVTRIGGVYTPPGRRGNGYASGCVAAASQHALDFGVGTCVLNTDLSNPTSNKIYQEIGYRPVGDWQEWSFRR
jgi:RimJ/RimL family protein N-acetyltransferase